MKRALAIIATAFALIGQAAAAVVEYTYDEIGRLVGVYAPSGDAAQYVYDPAGNITEIKRFSASQLSIIEFTPNSGPVGTTVTIWGTGFSTTPSSNTVTFNGTAATVSAATVNKLTVTVPAGATTGLIGVTVSPNSATSATPFTVTASSAAPTITNFSPTAGAAGTAVVVTGTNFDSVAAQNDLNFNATFASVSSASPTSISTTVPLGTASGKIRVRTTNGTAYSANDFLVPFGSYTAADLVTTVRTTVDGTAANFTISTAGKVAMILFDGTQGQNLGIGIGPLTFTPAGSSATVYVLRPDNVALIPSTVVSTPTSIDLPTLPLTGTYTIAIAPDATHTLSGTITVSSDVTAALGAPGAVTNATTTRAGQNARFTFTGTAGQKAGVYVASVATAIQPSRVFLIDPFGWPVIDVTSTSASAFIQAQTLTTSGTYTVRVSPQGNSSGSFTVQYGAPDLTVTAFTPGTPYANQNGSYSIPFTATIANQGTVGVRGIWADKAYLSSDATLDTSDRMVTGQGRVADVPSGTNYPLSLTGTAPAGTTPGPYTLFLKADGWDNGTFYVATDYLVESNESNNVASASITIAGLPDLSISTPTIGTITGNQNGSYNIPVSFTVTNVGAGAAKAGWYDECFLSTDATLNTADNQVGYQVRSTDLAASAFYNVSMTCITPTTTTPGSYTLFAKTDAYDLGSFYAGNSVLTESNEGNNVTSAGVTLPAKADLAITASSVGTITVNGNGSYNIPVSFTVRNVGTGLAAKASWYDACYLSTDATLGTTDDYLGWQIRTTDLAASSEYSVNMTCVTPTTTTAGNYTLFLKADGYYAAGNKYSTFNYLAEPDEANNVVAISITLPTKP